MEDCEKIVIEGDEKEESIFQVQLMFFSYC